ncbi:MAG: hypothetical protein ACKOXP_08025 [Flavobacteriales bacterium]
MSSNHHHLSYRFPFWLTVIFLLLIFIPLAILSDFMIVAKISGVLCLVMVLLAMKYWFSIAKKKSGVRDRVVLTKNDLFELERIFPAMKSWNKGDLRILKDRIGVLLANVEFRKNATEGCSRDEAILMAFQLSVYDWGNDHVKRENIYLYIGAEKKLQIHDVTNDVLQTTLTLGFANSFSSIHAMKSHYQSLNPTQD